MKVDAKISDAEVVAALNYLANNWKHNPELRTAFEAIFEKLKAGNADDQRNAQVLESYLSFPGSDQALHFSSVLHTALRQQDGRRVVGLPRNTRGNSFSKVSVKNSDRLMQELIKFEFDEATKHDVEIEAIGALHEDRDDKTIKKFIEELRPSAKAWAVFFSALEAAAKTKRSL